jgi:hypothetical protein
MVALQIPDADLDAALGRALESHLGRRLLQLRSITTATAARLLEMEEPAFRALLRRKGIPVERYSSHLYRIPLPVFEQLKSDHLLTRKPRNKKDRSIK